MLCSLPFITIIVHICITYVGFVSGHGRLLEPPSRSSMWRVGYDNPPNYNDNQLYCGGIGVQYDTNGGKCGVCGDAWNDSPREHEAGGKYANGLIVKSYSIGQNMDVTVQITANHLGWMEFKLCPNNDPTKAVTHRCLDKHKLAVAGTRSSKIGVTAEMVGSFKFKLKLPDGLSCTQCVLQWKYNAGNSWGIDPKTGNGCAGCGNQEQFYACSDIAIGYPIMDFNITRKSNRTYTNSNHNYKFNDYSNNKLWDNARKVNTTRLNRVTSYMQGVENTDNVELSANAMEVLNTLESNIQALEFDFDDSFYESFKSSHNHGLEASIHVNGAVDIEIDNTLGGPTTVPGEIDFNFGDYFDTFFEQTDEIARQSNHIEEKMAQDDPANHVSTYFSKFNENFLTQSKKALYKLENDRNRGDVFRIRKLLEFISQNRKLDDGDYHSYEGTNFDIDDSVYSDINNYYNMQQDVSTIRKLSQNLQNLNPKNIDTYTAHDQPLPQKYLLKTSLNNLSPSTIDDVMDSSLNVAMVTPDPGFNRNTNNNVGVNTITSAASNFMQNLLGMFNKRAENNFKPIATTSTSTTTTQPTTTTTVPTTTTTPPTTTTELDPRNSILYKLYGFIPSIYSKKYSGDGSLHSRSTKSDKNSDDEHVNGYGENVNNDGENVKSDGLNVNSDGENVKSNGENVNNDGENVQSDGLNVYSDGENVKSNGKNVNNKGENVNVKETESADNTKQRIGDNIKVNSNNADNSYVRVFNKNTVNNVNLQETTTPDAVDNDEVILTGDSDSARHSRNLLQEYANTWNQILSENQQQNEMSPSNQNAALPFPPEEEYQHMVNNNNGEYSHIPVSNPALPVPPEEEYQHMVNNNNGEYSHIPVSNPALPVPPEEEYQHMVNNNNGEYSHIPVSNMALPVPPEEEYQHMVNNNNGEYSHIPVSNPALPVPPEEEYQHIESGRVVNNNNGEYSHIPVSNPALPVPPEEEYQHIESGRVVNNNNGEYSHIPLSNQGNSGQSLFNSEQPRTRVIGDSTVAISNKNPKRLKLVVNGYENMKKQCKKLYIAADPKSLSKKKPKLYAFCGDD